MSNNQFWISVLDVLNQKDSLYCMVVIQSEGSSPGRIGFKMAVTQDAQMIGSIGGGMMEHKLVELCRSLLPGPPKLPFIRRQVHKADAASKSGMICSGSQTIAFYHLQKQDLHTIQSGISEHTHVKWTEKGFMFFTPNTSSDQMFESLVTEEKWHLVEAFAYPDKLYIVGAGHVGFALSSIALQLPFEVFLLDDRSDLNTLVLNSYVPDHRKLVIDYDSIDHHIPEGDHVYVAVVSFSFRTDEIIIRKLIQKKLKYFGVMGSVEKMRQLIEKLMADGISQQEINRMRTPIGIPINSKTPHEIAVSIAAQLIQIKNGNL